MQDESSSRLVQKFWNYCTVLRDDGLSYQDYLEQLTTLLFLTSHYIADAHMPFHCDNRRLGDSEADGHAHCDIEDLWGKPWRSLEASGVHGSKGCGEDVFWQTSRAIMHDAVTSIAMFWQDLWLDFVG